VDVGHHGAVAFVVGQVEISEVGARQVRLVQSGALKECSVEERVVETGVPEVAALKVRAFAVCLSQVRRPEACSFQMRTCEVGVAHVHVVEERILQVGAREIGAAEIDGRGPTLLVGQVLKPGPRGSAGRSSQRQLG
jgi:hypothetical protein